jgi:tRNA threonylcarbamoyladenosine biosynthesis protein TsaB
MKVLAFDTSFEACSAAICDGETICWRDLKMIGRGHAETLPVMVAAGLRAANLGVKDLDRIGVVIGPGAFAGVRVGVAFARGLCLGAKAKAVGGTSLVALAASLGAGGVIAPVFDARRGQVYAAVYGRGGAAALAPFVAAPEDAAVKIAAAIDGEAVTLAGSGAGLVAAHLPLPHQISAVATIDPAAIARLAARADAPAAPPLPLYLRPPDATPSRNTLFRGLGAP